MNKQTTRSTSDDLAPYVEFKDLPDTTTPIEATNLNNLQVQIKQDIADNRSVPSGGTTGQVLKKTSDSDYDIGWIDENTGIPVGTILEFAGSTAPNKYLLCNGQEVSRTDYSDLFSVIGTTYGEGDGSTTFNVPNHTGKLAIGLDSDDTDFNTLGKTGGSKTHTITINEMPAHTHNIKYGNYQTTVGTSGPQIYSNVENNIKTRATTSTGTGTAMNIMNPYIVTNYIIKAISG